MAVPAAILAAKAAVLTASSEGGRTVVFSVVAALLTPFLLIVTMLLCTLSGTADHNISAVQLSFYGGYLSSKVPAEYRMYIENMQDSFGKLDGVLSENNGIVTYEEREDEEGETYTVAVPIQSLNTVYENLASELNREIFLEDKTNAQRIYTLAKYGVSVPGWNGLPPGQAMGDGSFSALMAEATRYIGYPYVWGGSSPATSFDCSGYICWVYTQSGVYHLSRTTAQGIFDQCAVVSREEAKPGDLVFFTGTYASSGAVSHVGIYVGDSKMLHCGSPIGYANLNSSYWSSHLYAFGRLAAIPE